MAFISARRIGLVVVIAALSLPATAPHASGGRPKAVHDFGALASWVVPTEIPHRFKWYLIWVVGFEEPAEERGSTEAVLIRGRCTSKRDTDGLHLACRGRGHGVSVSEKEFAMDLPLSTARLKIEEGRQTHTAHWTSASAAPSAYMLEEVCSSSSGNGGRGIGTGLLRDARAAGRVYGERVVTNNWMELGWMWRGPTVTQCGRPWMPRIDWARVHEGKPVVIDHIFHF